MNTAYARFVIMLLGAWLLPGCVKRETPVAAGLRTQTLIVGNAGEPIDLDPHVANSISDARILHALFEGLTFWEEESGRGVPAAAERWDVSSDGLTYTFHLRPNLRWSNSEPLTAGDFVYSFQRILNPKFPAEYAYMLWPLKNAEAFNKGTVKGFDSVGAKALDERTLQLDLEYPTPYLPALVGHFTWLPVPRATLEKHSAVTKRGTDWTRAGNLVGNGPFVLSEWRPNARLVVKRNRYYWDAATTRLNAIMFLPIESADVEERNFRAGQLHVTWALPTAKITAYRAHNAEVFRVDPMLGTTFLRFNIARPPFNDARVRHALALAVDRAAIARAVTFGTTAPATALTPPGCNGYTTRAQMRCDFDGARRLLVDAGYPGGSGLSELPFQTFNIEYGPVVAEAIQAMWSRELGVRVGIESLELKTAIQNQQTKAYTISFLGWIADFVDPATFLELFVTDNGNNNTNWSHPEYDRLIAQAARTADARARLELFQQAEALLLEEAPIAPIAHLSRTYLIHPAVRGWKPALLAQHQYKHVALED
jgi:oligopeptide transport system substrate-binding protein